MRCLITAASVLCASSFALAQFDTGTASARVAGAVGTDSGSGLVTALDGETFLSVYPTFEQTAGPEMSSKFWSVNSYASGSAVFTPRTLVASGSASSDADDPKEMLLVGLSNAESYVVLRFTITEAYRWTISGSVGGTHASGTVCMIPISPAGRGMGLPIFLFENTSFEAETGEIPAGSYEFFAGVNAFTDARDGFNGLSGSASYVVDFAIRPAAAPPCPADADGNGMVTFNDITIVLANLGAAGSAGDTDGNGVVTFNDITIVLANLGATCE